MTENRKKVSHTTSLVKMVPSQWKYMIAESRINKEKSHIKDLGIV
jgi:hypothetical protein